MPSTIGTTVTANYLKASPSTRFGTRELTVIKVAQAGVFVDYALSNSLFSKSVRALQQTAEIYAVYAPVDAGTDYFCAIIATDTQWDGVGTGTGAVFTANPLAGDGSFTALEAAVLAGSGVAATVTVATLS